MSIHFAAARCASRSPVARALARKALRRAANDNADSVAASGGDPRVLGAALRHFAEHGVRAAEEAVMLAERAHRRGEADAALWWADVCNTLDRKMALALRRRMTIQDAS